MIALTLPFPPTINHYYGIRGKSRFIRPAGVKFRAVVAEIVAEAGHKTLEGSVGVFIRVFPPDRRKRDLDNLLKALQDALTHAGVWLDDSQIQDLHIVSDAVIKGGQTKIVITDLKQKTHCSNSGIL
jgi:crossover junction endodeoxyribonuclease RusA